MMINRHTVSSLILAAPLFLSGSTYAAQPTPLEWTPCENGALCGDLEFCQDGDAYGYRFMGDTTPCGSVPGPLLRLNKGQTYKMTLHNLSQEDTNLHTHGLHVVGAGDSDDVTRKAGPGECLTYTWDITSHTPAGTHWYHPHYHGTTSHQAQGGAVGMLVVNDDPSDGLPSWAMDNDIFLQIVQDNDRDVVGNGLPGENLETRENLVLTGDQWYRLRISTVTPSARPSALWFASGCLIYRVASDGIWHSAPFSTYGGVAFGMTGASRGDFAIKCSENSDGIGWDGKWAATITVSGSAGDYSTVPPGQAPPKPFAMENLPSAEIPAENQDTITLNVRTINGKQWDEAVPMDTLAWNENHEWTIIDSWSHPFHTHLYHMLVVSDNCGEHRKGEYYDTISSIDACKVRFVAADYGQRMVVHCHFLEHEDEGMIVWYDVQGDGMPENNNDGSAFVCPNNQQRSFLRGRV